MVRARLPRIASPGHQPRLPSRQQPAPRQKLAPGRLPPDVSADLADALPDKLRRLVRAEPNRRFMATRFYRLPEICKIGACRRARRCMVENAPCLDRHGCACDPETAEIYRTLAELRGAGRPPGGTPRR